MKKILLFGVMIGFSASLAHAASDRFVNHRALYKEEIQAVDSVEVLDAPPSRDYEVLQTLHAYDALSKRDDLIINAMRLKASKLHANALLMPTCKTNKWRMKTCTAKAIRWKID